MTSSRRVKSYTRPSADTVQLVARLGTTLPCAASNSTRRFISTSAVALVVVSELYCTTSKPSGLASLQTLSGAAWATPAANREVNNKESAAARMVAPWLSVAHLPVQSGKGLP
ncbi:hypothetical protein D3C76_1221590 [compost metagenome]